MKEKVRITCLIGDTVLYGKTLIEGRWDVLTEDFQQMSLYEYENNAEHKGKKMFTKQFNESSRTFDFDFETTDKPLKPKPEKPKADASPKELEAYHDLLAQTTAENNKIEADNLLSRRKRSATKNFFARHTQISHLTDFGNGHVCTQQPIATIEVLTQVAKMNVMSDWKKVKIFTKFMSYSWRQQNDAIMFYAPEFYGKRRSEGIYGMVGMKGIGTKEAYLGGALWKGKNADDFLDNYEKNPHVVMKIYISKAMALGLLVKGANGYYMNGSTFVGQSVDEAVVFFSKDMQNYTNFIQPQVDKLYNLPEDDMETNDDVQPKLSHFEKKQINDDKSVDWKEERKRTVYEAELLGIRNPSDIPQAELLLVISATKAKQNAIAENEGLPTTILTQAIDELATNDIEKLKEIGANEGIKGLHLFKDAAKIKEKIRQHRDEKAAQAV